MPEHATTASCPCSAHGGGRRARPSFARFGDRDDDASPISTACRRRWRPGSVERDVAAGDRVALMMRNSAGVDGAAVRHRQGRRGVGADQHRRARRQSRLYPRSFRAIAGRRRRRRARYLAGDAVPRWRRTVSSRPTTRPPPPPKFDTSGQHDRTIPTGPSPSCTRPAPPAGPRACIVSHRMLRLSGEAVGLVSAPRDWRRDVHVGAAVPHRRRADDRAAADPRGRARARRALQRQPVLGAGEGDRRQPHPLSRRHPADPAEAAAGPARPRPRRAHRLGRRLPARGLAAVRGALRSADPRVLRHDRVLEHHHRQSRRHTRFRRQAGALVRRHRSGATTAARSPMASRARSSSPPRSRAR